MNSKKILQSALLLFVIPMGALTSQAAGSGNVATVQPILQCRDKSEVRVELNERRHLELVIRGQEAKRVLFFGGADELSARTVNLKNLSFFFDFSSPGFYHTLQTSPEVVMKFDATTYGEADEGVFEPSQFHGFLTVLGSRNGHPDGDEVRVIRDGQKIQLTLYSGSKGDLASYQFDGCEELKPLPRF